MAAFSGKKYSAHKIRDVSTDHYNHEIMDFGMNHMTGNPRSAGKKYLPVRISTAHFENPSGSRNPGSSCKTMGLSSRKPIRNIHKLLESPKRNARKRLDNLYDCSKPKENVNRPTIKAHALSAKKITPKTPVISVSSNIKPDIKTKLIKDGPKARQSRLLPPGTITDSYLTGRKSLAPRNSIHKPINNRHALVPKSSQAKRPSDVPEESPQPLESSYNSSEEAEKIPLITGKKSTTDLKGIDNRSLINDRKDTSALSNPENDNARVTYCCKCSQIVNGSNLSEDDIKSADENMKILVNSKQFTDPGLILDKNETEDGFQRPTVIVMQKEAAPRSNAREFDDSVKIPVQDGSYSEILNLEPPMNSSGVNESLLFKHTERACSHLEVAEQLNDNDKSTEFICKIIGTSNEVLLEQKKYLTDSISEHEVNLTRMKLMLGNVNTQLDKQKTLKFTIELKGLRNLNGEELSQLAKQNLNENLELGKETKRGNNRRSSNMESRAEEREGNDSDKDVMNNSKQVENKADNIENEPPQRRRSARLAIKNGDQSLPLEESTPATGKKKFNKITQAKSKPCTPSMMTPLRSGKWGRRSERPLREYMVLKSAIKFLNTPDSRLYRIGSDENVKIRDSLDKTDQVLLTDKLLKGFHDLYATP